MKLEWRARLFDQLMIRQGMKILKPDAGTLAKIRARVDDTPAWIVNLLMGPELPLPEVRDLSIPGRGGAIPARLYRPDVPAPRGVIVFYHGGGWVSGDLETHDRACRRIAQELRRTVVAIDYRLAPEHLFPAAVEDAYDALVWVAENGETLEVDTDDLSVMGDSAGGNLAAVMCQLARDQGGPPIRRQALVYPYVDGVTNYDSENRYATAPVLTKAGMHWMVESYLGETGQREDARFSPLRGSLADLPAAYICCAEYDPIADHSTAYAAALKDAGNTVALHVYARQVHAFFTVPGIGTKSAAALNDLAAFFRNTD